MEKKRFVIRRARKPVDDLRKSLNDEQWAAVTAPFCPVLIIAGAGTGKTHTLTHRLAYMLRKGIPAGRVVLCTFTNRAAREMLQRVRTICGSLADAVLGGTFHHVANYILRRYAAFVSYPANYTILDSDDAATMINHCRADSPIVKSLKRFPSKSVLQDIYSNAANRILSIEQVVLQKYPDFVEFLEEIEQIHQRYQRRKREAAAMDYDDLLTNFLRLLRDEKVGGEIKARFEAVLVDEYQDTNALQAAIVEELARPHGNITVVGDDAQSIYSFRGAEFRNIITFPERWENCRVYRLVRNYRSTPEVLALTNASIAHNVRQFPKELVATRPAGPLPAVVVCDDVQQQAEFVAHQVLELREQGIPLNDIAVLYRSHWNAMELQVELARRGIPFEVRSGLRFWERAHIKDVIAFLRLVENPRDEMAWTRALKLFSGVGEKTAQKIFAWARESEEPLKRLKSGLSRQPQRARNGLKEFLRVAEAVSAARTTGPGEMMRQALAAGLEKVFESRHPDWKQRVEDIKRLADYADTFKDAGEFLSHIAIATNLTAETALAAGFGEEEVLVLSTVHRAKGLEWRAVFVIWCAEGAMPPRTAQFDDEIEEERRVFYVACTRAKEQLFLTLPRMRYASRRWGVQDEATLLEVSRFIRELPVEVYEPYDVEIAEE